MDLQGFIAKWDGKYASYPGAYGRQCVDLALYWTSDHGIPRWWGDAKDAAGQSWPGATWTVNCGPCVPSAGDVMVWGTAVGPAGHIAVFIDGDASSFNSFDQNWPLNSVCHRVHHNYNGVLGWQALHLTPAPAPPPSPPPPKPKPPPVPVPTPTPTPTPTLPPAVAPALLIATAGAVAGLTYWHHRRAGIPITPATLLQDLKDAAHEGEQLLGRGEHLAGIGLHDLERDVLALVR